MQFIVEHLLATSPGLMQALAPKFAHMFVSAPVTMPKKPSVSTQKTQKVKMFWAESQRKFAELDVDGSGSLAGDELLVMGKWALESLGGQGRGVLGAGKVSTERIAEVAQSIMSVADTDGNGQFSFSEFATWYSKSSIEMNKAADEATAADLEAASKVKAFWADTEAKFNEFDADKSGFLEGEELGALAKWAFEAADTVSSSSASIDDACASIMHADTDSDGKFTLAEFAAWFSKHTAKVAAASAQ